MTNCKAFISRQQFLPVDKPRARTGGRIAEGNGDACSEFVLIVATCENGRSARRLV